MVIYLDGKIQMNERHIKMHDIGMVHFFFFLGCAEGQVFSVPQQKLLDYITFSATEIEQIDFGCRASTQRALGRIALIVPRQQTRQMEIVLAPSSDPHDAWHRRKTDPTLWRFVVIIIISVKTIVLGLMHRTTMPAWLGRFV